MVVDAHQGQRRPGQLHGFEVYGRACGAGAFQGGLIQRAWGRAIEHCHGLQRQPMNHVHTAILEGQRQA